MFIHVIYRSEGQKLFLKAYMLLTVQGICEV